MQYNITTLFLSAKPYALTKEDYRFNATYEAKIYRLLQFAMLQYISIHFMTCEDSAFWNPVTDSHAAELVRLFLNYSLHIAPLYFDGITIDVEYYGEKTSPAWNWSDFNANRYNIGNYLISNGFINLSHFLSDEIHAHNQIYGDDLQFSAALAWFQHDAALKGLINGSYTELRNYYDFLIPMHAEMRLTPDQLYERNKEEIEILPMTIGIGSIDYTDFGLLARDINILSEKFQGNPHYLGICMYSYEYLITLPFKE